MSDYFKNVPFVPDPLTGYKNIPTKQATVFSIHDQDKLKRPTDITPEEEAEIQSELTQLWTLVREQASGTTWRANVWRHSVPLIRHVEMNHLNDYELKSFCEILMVISSKALWKQDMGPLKRMILSNVPFEKLFKGALSASRTYPDFKFAEFIQIWKQHMGDSELIQKYTNLV